jgi:hypothetical protein
MSNFDTTYHSPRRKAFHRIACIARDLCGTYDAVELVSYANRQWGASRYTVIVKLTF